MSMSVELYRVLRKPHETEKTFLLADKGSTYTFWVIREATKAQIAKAVSHLFSVEVKSVRTLNTHAKQKRFRGRLGTKTAWKKAYVTLAPGSDIQYNQLVLQEES